MGGEESKSANCFETKDGEHVTAGEIINAGAAQSRLEDHESPSPIGDALWGLVDAKDVNWNATPDNIKGPCDEHN